MNDRPRESDWKQFSSMIENLRDRYLQTKNRELVQLLTDPDRTPTEQFWDTSEKIRQDEKVLRECLGRHSRSNMFFSMALMCRCGMIQKEDLKPFSTELQGDLDRFFESEPNR
jgi:hypothetical protein